MRVEGLLDYQVLALSSILVSLAALVRGRRVEQIPGLLLGYCSLLASLVATGLSPGVVAATSLLVFSAFGLRRAQRESALVVILAMVALLAGGVAYHADPRGGVLLELSVVSVSAAAGAALAAGFLGESIAIVSAPALAAISLVFDGFWLLAATEAPVPLADAVFSISFLAVALAAYRSVGRIVVAAATVVAEALLVLGATPYLRGACPACAAALLAALLVASRCAAKRVSSTLRTLDKLEIASSIVAAVIAVAGPAAGLLGGVQLYTRLALLEPILLLPPATCLARSERLSGVLLGAAVAAFAVAVLVPHMTVSSECLLVPGSLGPGAPAPKPSQELVHDFYIVYLGAKNASIAYSILEPKLGEREALRLARFFYAISIAAEKRGIRDPYNITQLMHPEELPTLIASIECSGSRLQVEMPPRIALCPDNLTGRDFNVTQPLPSFTRIQELRFERSEACRLARDYLVMVSDPNATGGDALRYAIYTAMLVSWGETGNASRLARLLFSYAFNDTARLEPVHVVLVLRSRWPAALAFYAGVLLATSVTVLARRSH